MSFPATVPSLSRALVARGYETPTPVQDAVLRPGLEERDLLVSAQTGSGKTVAFGLAIAPTLFPEGAERLPPTEHPLALVIAPTRELAMQVQSELQWLYAEAGARIASCIGGTDARREARALGNGAHIVVGTPGRLCDHLSRGALDLSGLRAVVLDEADEMLDMGFREELEQLLDATPESRRTLLFSATIARDIAALARRYQKNAERIDTASGAKQHADIAYECVVTPPSDLGRAVINVLRYHESPTALLFCNTRAMVADVQAALLARGFASVAISGEMGQNERSRAIEALRSGVARVCVATDVAARGIDIPALSLVIHGNLPSDPATLLHRSGRTGRAGRKGTSVLMVPMTQRRKAERLLAMAKITNAEWIAIPTAEAIHERDAARLLEDETLFAPSSAAEDQLASRLAEAHDAHGLATALARLWQSRLPRVEHIRPVSVEAPARPARTDRPARAHDAHDEHAQGGEWFSLSIGRSERADPKWLIPLICRLGNVTKREIGSIRINGDHTLFEIAADSAERFRACIEGQDADEARIEPASAPEAGAARPPRRDGGRPPFRKSAAPGRGPVRKNGPATAGKGKASSRKRG
ncbi:DEAD/DEAH box helicase [Acidomonas methanolica]|uniref:DEAD/DEAH box helicase n=1 Tax=Acidomonas methanolica TaxID=437 RepID=UPI002119E983|nr:DEAD/DEAH box helicase [Acidomonas methanolica]MCQ9156453.1 DEAD/DEAH box helicase [Acidomonas methanolica]